MNNARKEYNLTLSRMYTTKTGNLRTVVLQDDELEAIQAVRKGGMIIVKNRPPEARANEKSPHAYLEYIKPQDVEAFYSKGKPAVDTAATDDVAF